jgi:hypothetical protein
MNADEVVELVEHEGHGWYWLMDSLALGWLVSKTYPTVKDALSALVNNQTEWVEQELKTPNPS